ncbi:MAG: thiamine diphosphokinase [Clostridiales bacterium]|jgi:thiamine pyrophosphokinase|nr:thiamine diphosphokinase [Clostridiales bacterium]
MTGPICHIVGAGEICRLELQKSEGGLIIAADAGYSALKKAGVEPDIVIGDFDSLPDLPEHPNTVRLNREKDDTDMLAAIRLGLARGYTLFHLYGGTGGRLDHTLANIQCLAFLSERNARGILFGKNEWITAVTNGSISLEAGNPGYISVFAHGEKARGVTLTGFKYPLSDATITNTFPIGVSNAITGKKGTVTVKDGTVIIVRAMDCD